MNFWPFKRQRPMRYFLVGYAHPDGFGNLPFGTDGPVDDRLVRDWEAHIGWLRGIERVAVISISEIDGPLSVEHGM